MTSISDLIDELLRASTIEDIHATCSKLCNRFGFNNFLYGVRTPTTFNKPDFIYITSYPSEWRNRYEAEHYMSVDPTVAHCATNSTPIHWVEMKRRAKEVGYIRQFIGEASEFGLTNGVSLPLHTAQGEFAMFNLATSDNNANGRVIQVTSHAQLFTAYLHEAVRRIFEREMLPLAKVKLSEREKECLLWTADGKTAWETLQILGVMERTITFHM